MKSLKSARIWLTGASSGIGEAMTYQLNKEQAKLVISSRRKEELERVRNQCAHPENVQILTLDLADSASLPDKAKEAEELLGGIDVLINNGGVSQREKAIETTLEIDRQIMEVNYFGSIALSKAVLPGMIKQGSGHHVVVSSAVGIISSPLRSAYAAAKHALHGFYDSLRAEHHNDNIKVTIALPGFIRTNISVNALKGDGSKQNKMDDGQANGISAEACAKGILDAVRKNKEEVYIADAKIKMGIYLKRFWPRAFSRMIRKMAVT